LCLRNPTVIVTGFDRANLDYHVLRVKRPAEKDAHLRALIGARSREVIIVYASTRGTVSRVASMLRKSGVAAAGYHAGLHERRRAEAQEAFMTGRARVLVATNAFGMGIDKPDVRMVIHYSMPGTLEAYYQEAGRAGRDGLHSTCVLLYSFADRFTHEYFLRVRAPSTETLSRVSAAVREACAASGSFDASWLTSHAAGRLGVSRAELESCVAILARGGLLVAVPPDTGIVVVRLLATPERIVRELAGNEMRQQLGLLRMLWRMFGRDLEPGVTVRMDRLRARGNSVPTMRKLLTDLQARQFLSLKYASPAWRRVTTGPTPAWSRNLAALERRRMAELAKLVAMENYARTRSCRRAFVLRYFGDTSRLSPSVCCDNCGCPIPGADALHSNAAGLRRHRQMSLRLGSKDR
jgi:ATP-dependent DNA helicase RecQ